jgi:hypothetical protein
MKRISREQAEQLFLKSDVVNTKVEYDNDALSVHLTLGNGKSFLMQYDIKNKIKSYFIESFSNKALNLCL